MTNGHCELISKGEVARLRLIESGARDSEALVAVLSAENITLKARIAELEGYGEKYTTEFYDAEEKS